MRMIAAPVLTAALMLAGAAAGREEEASWCGVEHPAAEPGLSAVSQAQSLDEAGFEDEVDLSGRTAVIDILFLYTKRAGRYWIEEPSKWDARIRGAYGASLRQWLEIAVDEVSAMTLNSGTNARLRLVGVERGPASLDRIVDESYTEVFDAQAAVLSWAPNSGEVAALRDRYGADLIYFVMDGPRWWVRGRATLPGSVATMPQASLGVLRYDYPSTVDDVLSHEVGHNLGLLHNRAYNLHGEPMRSGGRGLVGVDAFGEVYQTVMGWAAPVREIVPRYSTSSSTADGRVIGLPGEHEAADAFRFAAPYAAAIRRSKHVEDGGAYGCFESGWSDCVGEGRFRVEAEYGVEGGERKPALIRDAFLGDDGSLFYFYSWDNPELLVKVLDGCALNGHYWVFGSAATDREYVVLVEDLRDGTRQEYRRDRSDPLIAEVTAFPCRPGRVSASAEVVLPPAAAGSFDPPAAGATVRPASEATAVASRVDIENGGGWGCYNAWFADCMVDGRFGVIVHYWLPHEEWADEDEKREARTTANVRQAALGDNASLFYFFSWDNPELLLKVIDGCAINGHYWVFGSAATDLEYRVWVRDHEDFDYDGDDEQVRPGNSAFSKVYSRDASNPLIADTTAFRCELD